MFLKPKDLHKDSDGGDSKPADSQKDIPGFDTNKERKSILNNASTVYELNWQYASFKK